MRQWIIRRRYMRWSAGMVTLRILKDCMAKWQMQLWSLLRMRPARRYWSIRNSVLLRENGYITSRQVWSIRVRHRRRVRSVSFVRRQGWNYMRSMISSEPATVRLVFQMKQMSALLERHGESSIRVLLH